MTSQVYREKHRVLYYETDLKGRLKISNLFDLLMVVADNQSTQLGLSLEDLAQRNRGWVVMQHHLDVKRIPKNGELLTLTTQADHYNRFVGYRDFYIYDEQAVEIAHLQTVLVMIDQTTRKLISIEASEIEPFGATYVKKRRRLPTPLKQTTYQSDKTYRVRYLDIDINQHVNNVRYLDWIFDSLSYDFLNEHEIVSLNIQYKKEINYGKIVHSEMTYQPELLTSYHQITQDNETSCLAEIKWVPIKK
ncbi:acyl-[acyl-carrier-protein] thioesterase [Ligilactobacillus ceti]|uniref:Acyl-acyl carrier protein thioesterase n=1 Tax=Ligilactobacillus ceti DSM 22408 TaxID=1122146 RepID=A0A0R2KQK6_9LACO|nr:acyl-ACP thioesterase domain-containing protein [Ligilactobacillus ceti]KRN88484.1 acyl-acyl carrier protein thioesterase [Ligilactobacillus ceti DSM 22408]